MISNVESFSAKKISACEIVNPEISNFPGNAIRLMQLQQKLY